jgi:ubiquinone/menaquinone biosynthesis C-methylase UbiE
MNRQPDPEFDRFAANYEEMLQASLPASQAEDPYYAEYKVRHMAARMPTPSKVLDFGCGVGKSLPLLRQQFPHAELWGYDVSPDSLRLAQGAAPEARLTTDWQAMPANGLEMILAANVFHHIPPAEQPSTLQGCRKLLKPGVGRMFIFEHNPFNPVTRRVFERCPFDAHANMIPRSHMLELCTATGLRVVRSDFTLFFPKQLAALRPLERWLGWIPLGAQYCVELAA